MQSKYSTRRAIIYYRHARLMISFRCSLLLRVVARGAAAGGRAEHDVDLAAAADVAAGGADRAGRRPHGLLPRHDAGRRHQGEFRGGLNYHFHFSGLVNFVHALAHHFLLNLSEKFSQPEYGKAQNCSEKSSPIRTIYSRTAAGE